MESSCIELSIECLYKSHPRDARVHDTPKSSELGARRPTCAFHTTDTANCATCRIRRQNSHRITMDSFRFDHQHRIIICKVCSQAVSASQFRRHIQDSSQHRADFPKGEGRQGIVSQFETTATVDIKDLDIPSVVVKIINGLEIFTDGLACKSPGSHCHFITRQTKWIKRHAHKRHGWENPRIRGRPTKAEHDQEVASRPWITDIKCQQFFKTGPKAQLFEVRLAEEEDVEGAVEDSPLVRRAGTRTSDWKQRMEQDRKNTRDMIEKVEREERDLVHKSAKGEIDRWVERTGWARFLEGYRRRRLLPLIAKPDHDIEPVLFEITRRFDKIITVSQETVISRVSVFVKQEISRKDIHTEAKRPFNAFMEPDSMKRYRGEFKCVVWYILRTWMRQNKTESEVGSQESTEDESGSSIVDDKTGSDEEEGSRVGRGTKQQAQRALPKQLPKFKMSKKQDDLTSWLVAKIKEHTSEWPSAEVSEEDDEEILTGRLDRINRILLRWCIELFNHELGGSIGDDFNSPVIAALAIMGISSNGAWVSALNYTPKLSAIVKMVQMMVVQQAWEANQDGGKDGPGVLEQTRKMVEGFMTTHHPRPMKWIHDVRRYGFKIRMTTASVGTIRWMGERLQYQNIEFTQSQFRSMLHGLVDKAHKILIEDVFCFINEEEQRVRLPSIPWETMRDNPAESTPGWCFIDDPRNEWPVDGKTWMAERIWSNEEFRRAFIREEESDGREDSSRRGSPWRKRRVAIWISYVVQFKEALLLLMHITGGGPARTPEILSIRYRNTANGGTRNIFVDQETMVFVTEYHKGYGLSGQAKVIYRYLPREVGELLVWYLWLVLPLQQQFEVVVQGSRRIQPFLWSSQGDVDGRKWTGERMKSIMIRETGEGMGVVLNIADYRQCAAAIVDKYIGRQGGFDGETEEGLDEEEDDEGRWWDSTDRPEHLQFAHTSYEAMIGYARDIQDSGTSTVVMRMRWREISAKWNRHWGFPSLTGSGGAWESGLDGRRRARGVEVDWEEEDRKVTMRQWHAMKKINIQAELERMMGKGVEFRGVQEATLQAIVGGKSRILSIMGTGSGKSLTFMLPATFKNAGTTIVVVPMTSLRADMKRRCDELRIECTEWDSRRPPEKASLVLVTPESVPKKGFHGFLNRLRGMHRLERIVIDECHMVLDSSDEFRPKLLALREVMTIGCQVVMLTATMPPTEEGEFIKRMGLEGFDIANFRAGTTRKNIAYAVEEYDGSDEAAVKEIQRRREGLEAGGGKMIIYARSRDQVERLAEAIRQPGYHAKMEAAEKRRILSDFTSGKVNSVVATNALGMGIDIPDVRIVLHVEAPELLREYGQESGRAGRDGKRSEAIILTRKNKPARQSESMFARVRSQLPGRAEMRAFVEGEACRRIVIDEHLDGGKSRKHCEKGEGEELCDICGKRQIGGEGGEGGEVEAGVEEESAQLAAEQRAWDMERFTAQSRARVSETAGFEDWLVAAVSEWNGRCAVCKIQGRELQLSRHRTDECVNDSSGLVGPEIKKTRAGFRNADYAGCRSCGLPQDICERWLPTATGFTRVSGGLCQARWVLIDVVTAMIFAGGGTRAVAAVVEGLNVEGVDWESDAQTYEWFGRRVKVGSIETNRLTKVFMSLVKAFQEAPGEFRQGGMV